MPITKRHKSTLMSGIVVALGASMLAGCAADPIAVPKSETYTRDFIKTFGTFDQSHDWNHATQATVNVTTAKATDIKIYALVDNVRYLFGTYLGVEGQRTLSVDIPKGTTDLIVRANGIDHNVKPGGSLSLTSRSRNIRGDENNTTERDKLKWKIAPRKVFSTLAIQNYLATYKENDPKNLSKGTNSFYFVADGKEHTFYPFYWYTNAYHVLGIYVVDDENPSYISMHDLYFSKSGELEVSTDHRPEISEIVHKAGVSRRICEVGQNDADLPKILTYNGDAKNWKSDLFNGTSYDETKILDFSQADAAFTTPNGYISRIIHMNYMNREFYVFYETPTKDYVEKVDQALVPGEWNPTGTEPAYTAAEGTYIRTRGITYQLEEGTRYGFYIKVGSDKMKETTKGNVTDYDFIIFSNDERNGRPYYNNGVIKNEDIYKHPWDERKFWKDSGADELDRFAYASWGIGQMDGIQYHMFGFEDWPAGNNDVACDLNDIMFLFDDGSEPTTVIDTDELARSFEWIIACEDLGTDDFDFNDVVFGVGSKVVAEDGTTTCNITPLASGGTLPVYLYYNNEKIIPTGTNDGEFHSWFGSNSTNQIINAHRYNKAKIVHKLTVDKDFTLSCCQTVKGEGNSGNMGGFQVKVLHANGEEVLSAANPNIAEQIGQAPQMICVPYTWLWPVENKIITSVYEQFTEWCKDMNTHIDWHKNPLGSPVSHYVDRVITSGGSSSTGGSHTGIGDSSIAKPDPDGPDGPDGPKHEILEGEIIESLSWAKDETRVKYTVDSNALENAKTVTIYVEGITEINSFQKINDEYIYGISYYTENGKIVINFTSHISTLISDGGFIIGIKNFDETTKITATIVIEKE